MERVQLAQLFFSFRSLTLGAQCDAQIVVRLLKIGLQRDGAPKSSNSTRQVATGLEFPAKIVLRLRIVGRQLGGLAKLFQSAGMILLSSENFAEHQVRAREIRLGLQRLVELVGGDLQVAELCVGQSQLEVNLRRGFRGESALEFALGSRVIVLLRVNARQKAMRLDIRGIERHRGFQFFGGRRNILHIVISRAQSEMSFRPIGFEPQGSLEFRDGLFRMPAIFQCKRKVIVGERVIWFESQCLAVIRYGLIPGFGLGEIHSPFAVCIGSLSEAARRADQQLRQKRREQNQPATLRTVGRPAIELDQINSRFLKRH